MREWKFNNCTVSEHMFDEDLHEFRVLDNDNIVVAIITPDSLETMNQIVKDLDDGVNPVDDQWEDGKGNTVSLVSDIYEDYEVYEANFDEGHDIENHGMSGLHYGYHWYTVKTETGAEKDIYVADKEEE